MEKKLSPRELKDLSFMISKAYSQLNSAWTVLYDLDEFPFVEYDYKGEHYCLNRTEMMSKLNTVSVYFEELLNKLSDYDKE